MSNAARRPVAMITAASQGIGFAIAEELAKRGYAVSLLARSDRVLLEGEKLGGMGTVGSVAAPEDLARFYDDTVRRLGPVDAVVNNTGHPPKGDLLSISDEEWRTGVDLILFNVIRLARLAVPDMQKRKKGAFVNVSAFAAQSPDLVYPVSSTLRAGLGAVTRLFAQRYAPDNIRMNAVLPGFVDSYPV